MINLSINKYQTLFENKVPNYNLSTYFIYPLLDIPSYYSSFFYLIIYKLNHCKLDGFLA